MTRKDLIEKTFQIEGHPEHMAAFLFAEEDATGATFDVIHNPEHMAAFLVAEEEDRDIANADSIGQGQGPLPSFEDHLAEEPSLAECEQIRQRIYGFLAE